MDFKVAAAYNEYNSIAFTQSAPSKLKEALVHKQKQDSLHTKQRKSFAGLPLYKIEESFDKVARNVGLDQENHSVVELDFASQTAFVSTFKDMLTQPFAQKTKTMQLAF